MINECIYDSKRIMEITFPLEIRTLIGDFSILWNLYEKYLKKCAEEAYAMDNGSKAKYYQEDVHYGILKIFNEKINNSSKLETTINENFNSFNKFLFEQNISLKSNDLFRFFRIDGNVNAKLEMSNLFDTDGRFINNLKNKFHILLIIIYRVRNNMFHGNKDVIKLEEQKILFVIGCNIMSMMLEPLESKIGFYGNRR